MNAPRITSLAVVLLVTMSVELFAQLGSPVAPGDRVRVSRIGNVPRVVCTVLALKADTLVLDAEDRVETLEVPLALVQKVEISRGKKSNTGWGAIAGGLIGALLGAAGASSWTDPWSGESGWGSDAGVVVLGVTAAGAGIGALIGAATKTDRWEEVPLDDIRVGLSPVAPNGVAVSVALRLR